MKKFLVASAAMLALVAGSAFAASDDAIAERIKPFGTVCLAGDECASAVADAGGAAAGGAARSGEAVYGQFCTTCHSTGLLNAPKTGDTAAWQQHLDAAGSMDELLQHAINGVGAMPPKGTCANCTDEELLAAIEHMSGL